MLTRVPLCVLALPFSAIPTLGLTLADRHALTRRLWDLAVRELTPLEAVIPEGAVQRERPGVPDKPKELPALRKHAPRTTIIPSAL